MKSSFFLVFLLAIAGTPALAQRSTKAASAEAAGAGERRAFLTRVESRLAEATEAYRVIRDVQAQLTARAGRVPIAQLPGYQVNATLLEDRLTRIEYQLQPSNATRPVKPVPSGRLIEGLTSLATEVARSKARPTAASYTSLTVLSMEMDKQSIYLREALGKFLPRINTVLAQAGMQPVTQPAPAVRQTARH